MIQLTPAPVPVLADFNSTNLLDLPLIQGDTVTPLSREGAKTFALDARGRVGWVPSASLGAHDVPATPIDQLPSALRSSRITALNAELAEAAALRATIRDLQAQLRAARDPRTTHQLRLEAARKEVALAAERAERVELERQIREAEGRIIAAKAENRRIEAAAKMERKEYGAELEMLRRALGAVYGVQFGWE